MEKVALELFPPPQKKAHPLFNDVLEQSLPSRAGPSRNTFPAQLRGRETGEVLSSFV